jgi:hypothetical protein
MGILTDENGAFDLGLIYKIDETLGRMLSEGKNLQKGDIDTLAKKASYYFSADINEYSRTIMTLETFEHGSYGLPQGHEGLNDFFLSVCTLAIDETRLKDEIMKALKYSRS